MRNAVESRARWLAVAVPCLLWCWLAMLLTHELGHVVAVVLTGGELAYVNVYPGQIPSTLASPNPAPGVVLWGGFASGVLFPLAAARLGRSLVATPFLQMWSGFCLLANGAYLAVGGLEPFADSALLIKLGWPVWLLVPVGLASAAWGYTVCRRNWPALATLEVARRKVVVAWGSLTAWAAVQWLLAGWLARVAAG